MQIIDIVIIIMLIGGLAVGFRRGITRSAGAIAAIIIAAVACHLLGEGRGLPANMLIFAVAYIVVRLIAGLLHKAAGKLMLGPLDRMAGALFVAFEYMIGLSLLMNLWIWIKGLCSSPVTEFGSRAAQAVLELTPWLTGCLSTLGEANLL